MKFSQTVAVCVAVALLPSCGAGSVDADTDDVGIIDDTGSNDADANDDDTIAECDASSDCDDADDPIGSDDPTMSPGPDAEESVDEPQHRDSGLLYDGTFESYPVGTWSTGSSDTTIDKVLKTSMDGGADDTSVGIVSSPTSSGSRALKSRIRKDGSNSFRAEIVLRNTTQVLDAVEDNDMWFRFDVYLQGNATTRGAGDGGGIVMQWHAPKGGTNPVLILVETGDGWEIRGTHARTDCTDHNTVSGMTLHESSIAYNFWSTWVFQVRWDYRNDGAGKVNIWKDGTQVASYRGPIGCNDTKGPYLKLGNYSSQWRNDNYGKSGDERVQYHD